MLFCFSPMRKSLIRDGRNLFHIPRHQKDIYCKTEAWYRMSLPVLIPWQSPKKQIQ